MDNLNKNSFKLANAKTTIAVFLVVAMLAGFLLSRAVLSIAMILFGLNALWNVHPKKWLEEKWWLWGVVWIALFALSYFWSEDKGYWQNHVQVKLPLLLLPVSFAFVPAFSKKQLAVYTVSLCLILFFGMGYSAYFFLQNPIAYIEGYRFSNVLPTLPESEHIRFTLALALGIVWCFYYYPFLKGRPAKVALIICIFLFIAAIHIYAVRTGLLAFYVFITGYIFYLLFQKRTRFIATVSILFLFIASYLSFHFIPTLKLRVDHFKWGLMIFEKNEMKPEYGDIGRYISYDLALKIIKAHPLTGIGAGDIFTEMSKGYKQFYPQVSKELYLVPHNQFLTIAVAAGIPAMLVFGIWLFYPLREIKRNRNGFFFFITWLILLIPVLVEPILEIQFGLFVFIFFMLWQRQAMLKPSDETRNMDAADFHDGQIKSVGSF